MAIEFAQMKIYSRSKMRNAIDCAAYRAGEKLLDYNTGIVYNYSNKCGVVHSAIILPKDAGQEFYDREWLWNQVERAEKRKDAQLCKELILALPRECDLEAHIELVNEFSRAHFVDHGLACDVSIHHDNDQNPHAHILITTRRIVGHELSQYKARDLNPKFFNQHIMQQDYWNKHWRELQNEFFKRKGLELRVDPNLLIQTIHQGRFHGKDFEKAHINFERKQAALAQITTSPLAVLNSLNQTHTFFSKQDVACLLHKHIDDPTLFAATLEKVLQHEEVIPLGLAEDGRERYITHSAFAKELQLEKYANELNRRGSHRLTHDSINNAIETFHLNAEQAHAIRHVLAPGALKIIVGRAGTGKTHSMKAVAKAYAQQGFRVLGVSLSGIAADGLEKEAHIPSYTIARLQKKLQQGSITLSAKDVIVLDEAGMVNLDNMNWLLKNIRQSRAKLIVIGDPGQAESIGAGSPFRTLLERAGFAELKHILRQRHEWARQATLDFAVGHTHSALKTYQHQDCIHLLKNETTRNEKLVTDYLEYRKQYSHADVVLVAHQNNTVKALNKIIREALLKKELLQTGQDVLSAYGKINVSIQDRILFLKNNTQLDVRNGQFATVIHMADNRITAIKDDGRKVIFDVNQYRSFDYGYAATIHKLQGVTKKVALVVADGFGWCRNLTYVAMSRHREHCHVYASQTQHRTQQHLIKSLSRYGVKDAIIDFPLRLALAHQLTENSVLKNACRKLSLPFVNIIDAWKTIFSRQEQLQMQQRQQSILNRRERAKEVAQLADYHRAYKQSVAAILKHSQEENLSITKTQPLQQTCYDWQNKRNKLASLIVQSGHNVENALNANQLTEEELQQFAKQHDDYYRRRVYAKNTHYNVHYQSNIDKDAVIAALLQQAERFYTEHLGQPKIANARNWRYGNKGSLSVNVSGTYQGFWCSFETGDKGTPLQLLMDPKIGMGLSFKEALNYAARWSGVVGLDPVQQQHLKINLQQKQKIQVQSAQEYTEQRIKLAKYLVSLSKPFENTLAEHYLREHRKIATERLSADVRYLPASERYPEPKLLIISRNSQHAVSAVQLISLDKNTAQKNSQAKIVKHLIGQRGHTLVQQGTQPQIIFAEGLETAASLMTAFPRAWIYCALGSSSHYAEMDYLINQHQCQELILAKDNDGHNAKSELAFQKALEHFHAQGITPQVLTPELLTGMNKVDWNDVLVKSGVRELTEQVLGQYEKTHSKNLSYTEANRVAESTRNAVPLATAIFVELER
ncbi:MAG: Ti-type conjugative transfer relaxase TraA [Legionellales bacterium]|nr:Ti-type conjugative transfer relaxase TraA [Legionellales bacterium]